VRTQEGGTAVPPFFVDSERLAAVLPPCREEQDEEKCVAVFRPHPALKRDLAVFGKTMLLPMRRLDGGDKR